MTIQPEDIDFPVSETFAAALAQLHGWPAQPRCESLAEAREREDRAAILQGREEPTSIGNRAEHARIWQAIEQIGMDIEALERAQRRAKATPRATAGSTAAISARISNIEVEL